MGYRAGYRSYRSLSFGPVGFLIVANLVLFMTTSIWPEFFIPAFGLQPASFLEKPWTILTNLFVHSPFTIYSPLGSIWHILANMLTLYFFGSYLCGLVGNRNFLIVYFMGGILGNVVYLLLGPPLSIAIGASGAVFAVAGALTVLRPRLPVFIIPIPVPIPLWIAVIGGFLILSFASFVAWQAHLGGLVLGLLAGLLLKKRQRPFYWA